MTYPTDDLTTAELDNDADDPSAARSEILAAVQKIQAMIANTGTGASDALQLDSSGNIPSGVNIFDSLINELKGSDIASATTTDIGAATGNFIDITGTTTITGLGSVQAGTERVVQFDGALTLTYNATSLILPGNANITTAAGDIAIFRSLGSGNWICTHYLRETNKPLGNKAVTDADTPVVSGTSITITSVVTENTWESIGETGSGADNIWTALDGIPDDIDWIEVKIDNTITHTSGTYLSQQLWARPDGSTSSTLPRTKISQQVIRADGNGANNLQTASVNTAKINVSNKIFDIRWSGQEVGAGTPTYSITMILVAYGYN